MRVDFKQMFVFGSTTISVVLLLVFLGCISAWQFAVAFVILLSTMLVMQLRKKRPSIQIQQVNIRHNPLKGKPHVTLTTLKEDISRNVDLQISALVTYDASETASLYRFATIQQHTECIFAKKAQLWGSTDWLMHLSIVDNIDKFLPTFLKFTLLCQHLGLDGFVMELPESLAKDLKIFGRTVRDVLRAISTRDPFENNSMNKSYIKKSSWVYRFHRESFFVTTFAPCYPETNSRYGFCNEKGYILLQPEVSFAQYDIPLDTEYTNWERPVSARDKIRVAFQESGRSYKPTKGRPLVFDIVKPLNNEADFIEWWTDTFDETTE